MRSTLKSVALATLLCGGLIAASAHAQFDWREAPGTGSRFLMNKNRLPT